MKKSAEKRAWVRQHLGDITSDGELLTQFAQHFGMRNEDNASRELREIMDADASIEKQFEGSSAARHLALGQRLLDMMVADKAFGPASVVWKAMSQVKGLEQTKVQVEVSGAPNAEIVRARIAKLMADRQVREQAQAVGVDLDRLASGDKSAIDVGDRFSPAMLLPRRARSLEESEAASHRDETSETSEKDAHEPTEQRENLLATHLATANALGPR